MALSGHSESKYPYLDIPAFEPPAEPYPSNVFLYYFNPDKITHHLFAFISALTHGLNSFTAGTVIVSRFWNEEEKSLGEILENPYGNLSPLALAVGGVFGVCTFFANYAQSLEYMPKMKNDLFSLKILKENISKNKKRGMILATGLAFTAAAINSLFAWDTYRSISNPMVRYPFASISALVSFVITFAVRFVRTKQKFEEHPYFYSPEEYFILQLIKELKSKHRENLHRDEDLGRTLRETPYLSSMISIFNQHNIVILNRDELEETLSDIIKEKNVDPTCQQSLLNTTNLMYILMCTWIVAELFGEKTASKIPQIVSNKNWLWEVMRLLAGMGLSISHTITYYAMASSIFEVITRSYQTSPAKTLFGVGVNLGASPSMMNYYFSVANADPIIPLPKKGSVFEFIFGVIALIANFNLNYDSWASKFILPEPTLLEKDLNTLQKAIVEEKPVRSRTDYYHASRTLQSAFFKPIQEEKEKPGCWTRFRRTIGL